MRELWQGHRRIWNSFEGIVQLWNLSLVPAKNWKQLQPKKINFFLIHGNSIKNQKHHIFKLYWLTFILAKQKNLKPVFCCPHSPIRRCANLGDSSLGRKSFSAKSEICGCVSFGLPSLHCRSPKEALSWVGLSKNEDKGKGEKGKRMHRLEHKGSYSKRHQWYRFCNS